MVKVRHDADFAGLVSGEIGSSEVLSPKHRSLLSSYRLKLTRGQQVVHDMIVADINASLDLDVSEAREPFVCRITCVQFGISGVCWRDGL